MPNCPFLHDTTLAFADLQQEAVELFADLDHESAERTPSAGGWSPSQCIQHLNITAAEYHPRMEAAIARGRQRGLLGEAPFQKNTFLGRMILGVLDPAKNRTFKAPRTFQPRPGRARWDNVQAELLVEIDRLVTLARSADGLDLDRIRFASPIGPWPRLTLREAFDIHRLHIPRHLAQARRAAGLTR